MSKTYPVTATTMTKILTTVVAMLTCFSLLGCDSGNTALQPKVDIRNKDTYNAATDRNARFELMRQNARTGLAEDAKKDPEKVGYLTMSLWDYFPITSLLDFEKKYPNVKVTWIDLMVTGAHAPNEINPDLSLKDEINRLIQKDQKDFERMLKSAQELNPESFSPEKIQRSIQDAQGYLDAIKAGNVRTFGFGVRGKMKDLEAMAKQEENGKFIRVMMPIGPISTGEIPYSDYEPIYASDDKTIDRYK